MANRYWVGGSGTWDNTTTTNWSATSGGAGGASAPTSADAVIFDSNSGTGTVSFLSLGNITFASFNASGSTFSFSGGENLFCGGSFICGSTYNFSGVGGTLDMQGAGTLTISSPSTFNMSISIDTPGTTVTLGASLASWGNALFIYNGVFNTSGYQIDAFYVMTTGFGSCTFNLSTSTINISNSTGWQINNVNTTLSAGSSTINLPSGGAFYGGSKTYGTVAYTAGTTGEIRGANTFTSLTLRGGSNTSYYTFADNQSIGTFAVTNTTATARCWITSSVRGTSRTLTISSATLSDVDFTDIVVSGSASPLSGSTRLGDAGNNSGIAFSSKTVYLVNSGAWDWNANSVWATSSGGTGAANNYPLPQDTAVIDDNSAAITTITIPSTTRVSTVDASSLTGTVTISLSTGRTAYCCGNWTNGSGLTLTGTGTLIFQKSGTSTITGNGVSFTQDITIQAYGSTPTVTLGGALITSGAVTLTAGTLSLAGYSLTASTFDGTGTATRGVSTGEATIFITGAGTVWQAASTGFTKTGTLSVSLTGSSARTVVTGIKIDLLNIGGGLNNNTTLSGTVGEITSSNVTNFDVLLTSAGLTLDTWSIKGQVGVYTPTLNSDNGATRRTLTLTNITSGIDYIAVGNIGVSAANKFYVGNTSTDLGNNNNVIFTDSPVVSTGRFFLLFAG